MEFKLNFKIPKAGWVIEPSTQLFFAGSCFAENMADYFDRYKFKHTCNTHGILFNPISIATSISDCINNKKYSKEELLLSNELYCSLSHHGRFSSTNAETCLQKINNEIKNAQDALLKTEVLFITFGSAFAYIHKESNRLVANCHKIPQNNFTKILLDDEIVISAYNELTSELKRVNPNLKIVFTVSPVRYIRDGIVENNHSKAILLKSVHSIIKQNNNCFYFPAYEIVMDELRDYRYFEEDMVHPNKLAVKYVWERLVGHLFSEATKNYISELESLINTAEHRPLNPDTTSYITLKKDFLEKCLRFEKRYPNADLSIEKLKLS